MVNDLPALNALLARVNAARHGAVGDAAEFNASAEAALDSLFGMTRRLAVYGTLAPGEVNHREVAGLGGEWHYGEVHGYRTQRRFPAFTWNPSAPPVPMLLLIADRLPAHWPALDAFEGPDYRRILVPVLRAGALFAVANLYTAVTPVPPAGAGR